MVVFLSGNFGFAANFESRSTKKFTSKFNFLLEKEIKFLLTSGIPGNCVDFIKDSEPSEWESGANGEGALSMIVDFPVSKDLRLAFGDDSSDIGEFGSDIHNLRFIFDRDLDSGKHGAYPNVISSGGVG